MSIFNSLDHSLYEGHFNLVNKIEFSIGDNDRAQKM